MIPIESPARNTVKKIRFPDDEDDYAGKDKRDSFGSEKIVKLTRPSSERDLRRSTLTLRDRSCSTNQIIREMSIESKAINEKPATFAKTPQNTPTKAFTTPRRRLEPSRTVHTRTIRQEVRPHTIMISLFRLVLMNSCQLVASMLLVLCFFFFFLVHMGYVGLLNVDI